MTYITKDAYHATCTQTQEQHNNPCPYDEVFFLTLHDLRVFSNENGAGIGAFVTLFIALFTWFLVDSTDRLWEEAKVQRGVNERAVGVAQQSAIEAKRSADVAEETLIATTRPWIFPILEFDTPVKIANGWAMFIPIVSMKNTGGSPAMCISAKVRVFKGAQNWDDNVGSLIAINAQTAPGWEVLFHNDSVSQRIGHAIEWDGSSDITTIGVSIMCVVFYKFPYGPQETHYIARIFLLMDDRTDKSNAAEIPADKLRLVPIATYTDDESQKPKKL